VSVPELQKFETPVRSPAPLVTNQEPADPIPNQPPKTKKPDRRWILILVILLVLLCICLVIVIAANNASTSFWCKVLPFIFNPQNYNCAP
jgi:hypothetical protein